MSKLSVSQGISDMTKHASHLQQHLFEHLKRIEIEGCVYWSSRQLAHALGYRNYSGFYHVLRKAKLACEKSCRNMQDHFREISEEIKTPHKDQIVLTLYLSRFACYLAIQNANPNKENVALSQSYLASQRYKTEMLEHQQSELLDAEEMSRLLLRNEVIRHNKELASAARNAGVVAPEDFSAFQNQGYMGLYHGLDRKHLHAKKGLRAHQKVLDYMGSTELAANLFRVTQTEEKLVRDHVTNKLHAYKTHYNVGATIRNTIEALGGTPPENLAVPDKSVKHLERKQQKIICK